MRRDIQFLRGIAVLVVVFYHAGVAGFANGFLGVDIFFVISGFLITTIILRDLDARRFSFGQFYLRRAKRLLPALYCTLLVTSCVAYVFLTQGQWRDTVWQLIGSVTFSANMVLPFQVGYFDGAAETKPLLHVWSLSLEEQYYLALPLLLWLTPAGHRLKLLVITLVVSLIACVVFVTFPFQLGPIAETRSDEWAFYLFPTRAWELLAGSITAWWMLGHPEFSVPRWVRVIALLVVLPCIGLPIDSAHPRTGALLVIIGTVALIIGRDNWLPDMRVFRFVERIGDLSYSLYLVHWPLFSFAYVGYLETIPVHIKPLLIAAALGLAWLQFRYIEQPFRYGWKSNTGIAWGWLAFATVLLLMLPLAALMRPGGDPARELPDFAHIRRINIGLSPQCAQGLRFRIRPACISGPDPKVAVWGDSYAMHLIPGLQSIPAVSRSLVQITKRACGPFFNTARKREKKSLDWSRSCIQFNHDALAYIRNSASIEYVVLSAALQHYVVPDAENLFDGTSEREKDPQFIFERFAATITQLREAGKHPIVVSPPPGTGANVGECLERQAQKLPVFGYADCAIDVSAYERERANVIAVLRQLEEKTGVDILWLDETLCSASKCRTRQGDLFLYRDTGHLTVEGSQYVMTASGIERFFAH